MGGPGTKDPGRISYKTALITMVLIAYNLNPYQVSAPGWMTNAPPHFSVEARYPPDTTREQFRLMLQNLLAERFHLQAHWETKELPGYALVIGKHGAKLKETDLVVDPANPPRMTAPPQKDTHGFLILPIATMIPTRDMVGDFAVVRLTARAQPTSALIRMLSDELHAPIADKTGLTAKYDFHLEYMLGNPRPGTDQPAPTMMEAVEEQLGLKLAPAKTPVEMLILDSAEKIPTEN